MSRRLGLVIDQERCIGCEACTVACRLENRSSTFWIRVETQPGGKKDRPAGRFPDLQMSFLPRLCQHCGKPPCVDACPQGALSKRADGPVVLDDAACDGCRACMDACPYSAISYRPEDQKVEKCNLCHPRIDRGLEPFCVICCEGQAMHFGDLNDPESPVAKRIAQGRAFRLKPEAGTDPSVYYCPPRERRKL